jgi:hypothetical protein
LHPQQSVCLDHANLLINGNPAGFGNLTSSVITFNGRISAIVEATADYSHLIGQVILPPNSRTARLSFILCNDLSQSAGMSALIEFLSYQAGENQAVNLLAEVENSSGLFEILRRSGFSAYGIETIWQLPAKQPGNEQPSLWVKSSGKDEIGMRSLYQSVTPPLEQGAEPYQSSNLQRLVYSVNNEINAWVQYSSGPLGIYLAPVMHPSINNPGALLCELSERFSGLSRPVYLQIRSHQSWLSTSLEDCGAQSTGEYTLLVKHLALGQKVSVPNGVRARVEARQAKPTIPILHNMTGDAPPTESKNGLK